MLIIIRYREGTSTFQVLNQRMWKCEGENHSEGSLKVFLEQNKINENSQERRRLGIQRKMVSKETSTTYV